MTMTETFTDRDREQMDALGISLEEARRQLALFESPPEPIRLDRPARLHDGIVRLSERRREELTARFEDAMLDGVVGKFVPASGAATRMFKGLTGTLHGETEEGEVTRRFFAELDRFPFRDALAAACKHQGFDLGRARDEGEWGKVLEVLLEPDGLGYADLPKGLIPFHRYPDGSRTPFEEHLVEAASYGRDAAGVCRLHFTVAPEHEERSGSSWRPSPQATGSASTPASR